MDNWNFTGKPDVPAWPRDAQGQDEKAVLLMQTFDSPADTDMIISLLAAYGIPCFKYYGRRRGKGHQRLFRLRRQPVCARSAAGGGKGPAGLPAGGGRGNGRTRLKGVFEYAGL